MAIVVAPRSLSLPPPTLPLRFSPHPPNPSVKSTLRFPPPFPRRLAQSGHRAAVGSTSSVAMASPDSGAVDATIWEALDGVRVFSAATGEPLFLRDLWDQNEGVAVVALLRHFGCICCWEMASVVKEAIPRFESAGVKLIAVGVGTSEKACILVDRLPFPPDYLYADPDRKAYDVLGLYFGLGRTFFNRSSMKVFSRWDSLKKAGKNYTISATPDDKAGVLQQGGVFVFRGKQLLYARKDEGTGDHAPLDEVFNACSKIPVA